MEEKIAQEKPHLMHILEESLNEIYMFDSESLKFSYVNKGALSNIGYTMEEMSEMTPLDIKPEFTLASFLKMIEPLKKKKKKKIVFETVHKRADGSLYDIEVHLQLEQNIPEPVFVAIILDITDRKNVEEEKDHLLHVVEESLNEIYMFDSESLKFSYVNKGALSNIGYTMKEMSEMTPLDIKPEFTLASFLKMIEPLKNKEKKKIVFETVHKRADGSLYDIEVHLQLEQTPSNPVFVAIILDITERRSVEEEKDHLLHVIEESLNEIYMFSSETLRFSNVNKGALLNIGYTMEEMSEMTPLDIKPEFDLDSFEEMIKPLRDKEQEKIVFETVHKRADGSLYDVEVHLQLIQDISKPVFVAIILDITERKKVENEILQLNENLEKKVEERTASLMSYQNQLRSLAYQLTKTKENERERLATFLHDNLGQVLAIGKMQLDEIKRSGYPGDISTNLKNMEGLIKDAIRFTRELMSDLKPAPTARDVDLVDNISWISKKMKKYGLDVTIKDDGQPKQLSEEIRNFIIQSVRELLYNVVKHAEVNKAEIIIEQVEDQVQVIVKDSGKGFNSEEKKLEPTKMDGFGLFQLQEQMNWLGSNMEIVSSPGEGTQVKLVFPVLDEKGDRVKAEDSAGIIKPVILPDQDEVSSKIKVLIADDHQLMREGLRKMIEGQEDLLVTAEASNGREAVNLTRKHHPDIVIMDINMPEMDGIEATRQIIQHQIPVRVIGLSFHEDENVAQSILDAGASVYLTKSEVFETLCATVRSEGMILKNKAG